MPKPKPGHGDPNQEAARVVDEATKRAAELEGSVSVGGATVVRFVDEATRRAAS